MDRAQEKYRRLLIVSELVWKKKLTTNELRQILAERFAINVSYRTAHRDLALIASVNEYLKSCDKEGHSLLTRPKNQ